MDKIFINAKIYNMDKNRNVYQSFAINENKIEALENQGKNPSYFNGE